jgi:hypothetical protein
MEDARQTPAVGQGGRIFAAACRAFLPLCLLHAVAAGHGREAMPRLELIGATQLPPGARHAGVRIGGLSGLDRAPDGSYRAISDDRGHGRPPRLYTVAIATDASPIVAFAGQTILRAEDGAPFPIDRPTVDPEAIRVASNGHLFWSSEGNWSGIPADRTQSAIYETTGDGRVLRPLTLPAPYLYRDNATGGARANGTLEGLAIGPRGTIFAINEAPAFEDKPAAAPRDAPNPLRLTVFNPASGRPVRQFGYVIPEGRFTVSELLAIDERSFLTIERVVPFDAARGVEARLVQSCITPAATDVLGRASLAGGGYTPMARRVLLDLPFRYHGRRIDNLEAMAWGGRTPDGARTLIVASDNNFSPDEVQQFFVFRPARSRSPAEQDAWRHPGCAR